MINRMIPVLMMQTRIDEVAVAADSEVVRRIVLGLVTVLPYYLGRVHFEGQR